MRRHIRSGRHRCLHDHPGATLKRQYQAYNAAGTDCQIGVHPTSIRISIRRIFSSGSTGESLRFRHGLDNSGNYHIDTTIARHLKVSNLSPVKPNGYVTLNSTLTTSPAATALGTRKFIAVLVLPARYLILRPGYAPNNTTVACLNLACSGVAYTITPQGNVLSNDPTSIQLTRGLYDTDGTTQGPRSTLAPSASSMSPPRLRRPTKVDVHTTWDQGTADAQAAFSYTINARAANYAFHAANDTLAWQLTTTTRRRHLISSRRSSAT